MTHHATLIWMLQILLFFCNLQISKVQSHVLKGDQHGQNLIHKYNTAKMKPCTAGYLKGECTYALECQNSKRFSEGTCMNGFRIGVCCTNRTTINTDRVYREIEENAQETECGKVQYFPRVKGRVVNGTVSGFGMFPWTVSIRLSLDPDNKTLESAHYCGGTLVNKYWVVSSAHCIHTESVPNIVLRLGEYNTKSNEEPFDYVERTIGAKIEHSEFRIKDYYSDIALLRMNEPVAFQPNIQPICLPGNKDFLAGRIGIVSGWGRLTEKGDKPSEVIRKVSLPIMTNEECEKMFQKGKVVEDIYDVFLCAGYENGARDACTGDSGGPLQLTGKDDRVFLAGIVSWGYGCSRPYKPGVYTRISEFIPWILEIFSFDLELTKIETYI